MRKSYKVKEILLNDFKVVYNTLITSTFNNYKLSFNINNQMTQAKKLLEKLPKHKMLLDPKCYRMAHPVYSLHDIEEIPVTHRKPENFRDRFVLNLIRIMRGSFDLVTRYNEKKMTTHQWLN